MGHIATKFRCPIYLFSGKILLISDLPLASAYEQLRISLKQGKNLYDKKSDKK